MAASGRASLARGAHEVLERNRRGAWTCPSDELYPHQWLWDSCFIAIGLARYDAPRARTTRQASRTSPSGSSGASGRSSTPTTFMTLVGSPNPFLRTNTDTTEVAVSFM
jgi:hypothetical protein